MSETKGSGPRCAALVGPYLSGKTTLLESLLFATGAIQRKGNVKNANTVGDSAEEARARQMSTELSVANAAFLGDSWSFIDCPGSIELAQDGRNALLVADIAIVVCEPEPDKALTVAPLLKMLDEREIPHMVFINKMDHTTSRVRDILEALQAVSDRPLVLRQVPIVDGETVVTPQLAGTLARALSGKIEEAEEEGVTKKRKKLTRSTTFRDVEVAAMCQLLEILRRGGDPDRIRRDASTCPTCGVIPCTCQDIRP